MMEAHAAGAPFRLIIHSDQKMEGAASAELMKNILSIMGEKYLQVDKSRALGT